MLALALPWFIVLAVRIPGFASYFFWEHNIQRFLAPGMHVRGIWFYGPVLAVLLLPGSLLAVSALRFLASGDEAAARLRSSELGFHLLAGGWCVLFFTLSACKLPTYILPAFPFLALVLGYVLAHSRWNSSRLPGGIAAVSFAAILLRPLLRLALVRRLSLANESARRGAPAVHDRAAPVVCYPRNCDSIAFYLRRSDLRTFRSKDIEELRTFVRTRPRTVILCTHRHSLAGLRELLPPEVRIVHEVRMGLSDIPGVPHWLMKPLVRVMGETALGLSDLAVVEGPPSTLSRADKALPRRPMRPFLLKITS